MNRAVVGAAFLAIAVVAASAQAQEPPLEQARAFYDAGRLDDARRLLDGLVRQGSDDPGVFQLLGVVERKDGHVERAIAAFERAQALAPDSTPINVELATTLAWNRDLDRAIAIFRNVLVAEPANAGARSGLGFALAWQGRHDEARQVFAAMTADDPQSVSGWSGLGFVDRASLRLADAERSYQRVLALDSTNAEAAAALETLRWEGRRDLRLMGGLSSQPDVPVRGEARVDLRYAIDYRRTLFAAYQHYAYGASSPLAGGGVLVSTREEDSIEAGFLSRPTSRTTLAASVYTFFSDDVSRGTAWIDGAFKVTSHLSLIGSLRPAFSNTEPEWLMAGVAGAALTLGGHEITVRGLIAANTTYEPRLTMLANYDAPLSPRIRVRLGAATSRSDERFNFTSVNAGATCMLSPSVGVSAEATRRFETAERSTLLLGIVLRR